jgi:hypothetical protein
MYRLTESLTAVLLALAGSSALAEALPQDIVRQLPRGYEPMKVQIGDFNADQAKDYIVVVAAKSEKHAVESREAAPKRRLLAFIQTGSGSFTLVGQNDEVAFAADQALQCDPFLDGQIAVKGSFFTVENDVACGQHWTFFITFKYDKKLNRFLFHKEIVEVWELNSSTKPDAEALVLARRSVKAASALRPVFLDTYSPE